MNDARTGDGIAPGRAEPGPSRTADGIAPGRAEPGPSRTAEVLARVCSIPEGFVTTYGDLCPGAPRLAGAVLSECDDPEVPWQRVVRADGSLAKGDRQRQLLEREGVPFRGARVDMREAWAPPQR